MCSTMGVDTTDVLHIQQESPRTRVLRIAVAVLREVPAIIDGWVEEFRVTRATMSSLFLDEHVLLLEQVIGTLEGEDGIDNEEEADPHARLTILSHLLVAAIFDKEGCTLEDTIFVVDTLLVLETEDVTDPVVTGSTSIDEETVTCVFGNLA